MNRLDIKAILIILYYSLFEKYPDATILDELETAGFNKIDLTKTIVNVLLLLDNNPYNLPSYNTIFNVLDDVTFIASFNNIDTEDMIRVNELLQNDELVNYIIELTTEKQLQTESLDMFIYNLEAQKISDEKILDAKYRFVIHKHDAKRAGTHYDLRIEIAKDFVYSIAFRYNPLNKDKAMGIVQPIHTSQWLTFEGEIEEGYGAGKLTIIAQGTAVFYKSDDTIIIKLYNVKDTKIYQYAVVKLKDKNKLLFVKTSKEYNEHPTVKEVNDYLLLEANEKIAL